MLELLQKNGSNFSRELLLEEGYSREDVENLSDILLSPSIRFNRPYNRMLSPDEEQFITIEAYGYLLKLLSFGSIDEYTYEKIILISSIIGAGNNIRLNKNMMKKLVDYMLFSWNDSADFDEMLDSIFDNSNDNRLLN